MATDAKRMVARQLAAKKAERVVSPDQILDEDLPAPYMPGSSPKSGMATWRKVAIGGGVAAGLLGIFFGIRAVVRK